MLYSEMSGKVILTLTQVEVPQCSPDVIENHKRLYVTLDFDDLYRSIFNHNSNFI